jgi:hypothetical protein
MDHHIKNRVATVAALLISFGFSGCASTIPDTDPSESGGRIVERACAVEEAVANAEQAQLFRQAETDRAEQLSFEIERLQADLRTAESALVDAESGLAGSHSRADVVSSLAVTRIQLERAASRAPWREREIAGAREKLDEAEHQVSEARFGAALFFVYRARRVAESIMDEAEQVMQAANAKVIRVERVNLRAGPSTNERVLSVLDEGTLVIPQANEGEWTLVQVLRGPAGWINRRLLDGLETQIDPVPSALQP